MTHTWSAEVYSQFLDLRTRPARDLLSAVPTIQPKVIYDLGCGPGNSTVILKDRWPGATVIGLDSSSDMIDQAKKSYPDIEFILDDIENFSPKEKIDCLFANASLHWLKQHEILFPKLLSFVNQGGVFAVQMPNNFHSPSHQAAVKVLQSKASWQPYLKKLFFAELKQPLFNLSWYYDVLMKAGVKSLQIWQTEYFQEMSSHKDIFDWVKGTGIRPALSAMNAADQSEFEKNYIDMISKEYLPQANKKILLPFRRVFMVSCV